MNKALLLTIIVGIAMVGSANAAEKAKAKPAAKPAATSAAPAMKSSGGRNYGMAGCGLGSLIVGKNGPQIIASTTNGTVGDQTFGITFGTSNCEDKASETAANRVPVFVAANKDSLANDIARGGGETLNSLYGVLGCTQQGQLNSALQKNFHSIYPNEQVQEAEISERLLDVIKSDAALAGGCTNLT